jgi:hypothetical protein
LARDREDIEKITCTIVHVLEYKKMKDPYYIPIYIEMQTMIINVML